MDECVTTFTETLFRQFCEVQGEAKKRVSIIALIYLCVNLQINVLNEIKGFINSKSLSLKVKGRVRAGGNKGNIYCSPFNMLHRFTHTISC